MHLRSMGCHLPYGITQCYGTFHPTQVNTSRLNPSQRPVLELDLPTPEGWVDLGDWLHYLTYRDGLPVDRRSPIHVLTRHWQYTAGSRIFDLTSYFQDGSHDVISRRKVLPSGESAKRPLPQFCFQFLIHSRPTLVRVRC